jgi:hypothetical protein
MCLASEAILLFLRSGGVSPQGNKGAQRRSVVFFFGNAKEGGVMLPGLPRQTSLDMNRQINVFAEIHHYETECARSQKVFGSPDGREHIGGPDYCQGRKIDSGICGIGGKKCAFPTGDPGNRLLLFLRFEHQSENKR